MVLVSTSNRSGTVRVVAVAVVDRLPDGPRVLAARRTRPAEAAGRWELPGGKCGAEESLEEAAVRELHEELGCTVRVTGRLPGTADLGGGLTLKAVTAEVVDGEPLPTEHDALRRLRVDELEHVDWLAADTVFLPGLRALLGEHLPASGTVAP
jgi:8-oxo-dGTP diphosphatase